MRNRKETRLFPLHHRNPPSCTLPSLPTSLPSRLLLAAPAEKRQTVFGTAAVGKNFVKKVRILTSCRADRTKRANVPRTDSRFETATSIHGGFYSFVTLYNRTRATFSFSTTIRLLPASRLNARNTRAI